MFEQKQYSVFISRSISYFLNDKNNSVYDGTYRNIGIFYGNDSMVAMVYRGTILSLGNLPVFYQDKENSTMFDVVLEGVTSFGYGLHSKLVEDSNSGQIPLIIFIKVPVVLQAWAMDTKELTVYIQCNLVVDSLQSDKKVDIISAKYRYNVKF